MRFLAATALLALVIIGLAWSISGGPSTPPVANRPRLVNTIIDEGDPCVSGPRVTTALLDEWPGDYRDACIEIRLDVECSDECTAPLPSGRVVVVTGAAAMRQVRGAPQSRADIGLLGRFRIDPRPSLDVARVMDPWW